MVGYVRKVRIEQGGPMLPPRRPWTFRGLRAVSSDGDEEAEEGTK